MHRTVNRKIPGKIGNKRRIFLLFVGMAASDIAIPRALTTFFFHLPMDYWIGGDQCYGFQPVESESGVKKYKKPWDRGTHWP